MNCIISDHYQEVDVYSFNLAPHVTTNNVIKICMMMMMTKYIFLNNRLMLRLNINLTAKGANGIYVENLTHIMVTSPEMVHSLLTQGKIIKTGELWAGKPAKFLRMLNSNEKRFLIKSAERYYKLSQEYLANLKKNN